MANFKREDFNYHGGYLMYSGDAGKCNEYYPNDDSVHPTRKGTKKELFVARFKYSGNDKGRFLTFLINNFTPEEFFTAVNSPNPNNPWSNPFSPAPVLAAKGYISSTIRKGMKKAGYTIFNKASYRKYFESDVSSSGDCSAFWAETDKEHAAILAACAGA